METPFRSFSVQWIVGEQRFTNESLNNAYPDQDIQWFNHPPSLGDAGFTSLKLASGMSVHHSIFRFPKSGARHHGPIALVDVTFREPTLVVQAVLSGNTTRREISGDALFRSPYPLDPNHTLIKVESNSTFELAIDPSADVEIIYLHANASSLRLLLGETLAEKLFAELRQQPQPTRTLPAQIISPLKFCFDQHLEGPMLKLHAQSKAIDFLSGLIRYRSTGRRSPRLAKDHRAQSIRDHICACGLNLPNTQQLSQKFGLTPRTLNAAFLNEYGMTVARYIKEHRLLIAHEQLANTDVSIREIASMLGFSQVSNFSATFKAQFGYPPTSLRRKPATRSMS
uniref:helix-turn-helix domain-containing protein n=1 Tax=Orrella sp. TaxID=1921583 RepID=UPI0040554009